MEIVQKQREFYHSGETLSKTFRINMLKKLKAAIIQYEDRITEALNRDLNKPAFEAYTTEIGIILDEIKIAIRRLPKWMKRKKVRTPLVHFPSRSYIYSVPYGITLIMSPWNYPFQLAVAPLIGAIAGGNCCVIKPSEHSPHTSRVLAEMIEEFFEESYVTVIEGEMEVNQALLKQNFDYIFFTGSTPVGKIVMEAAAKNLTPVTLELGGKSPCLIDDTAKIDLAARRIVWGKFINAGQTCVAPDYLLVDTKIKDKLLSAIDRYIKEFYGENPLESPDYPAIINNRHFKRLLNLIHKETVVIGGESNQDKIQIAPTILDPVSWDAPVMADEIFGPILPVVEYEDFEEAVRQIKARPNPLALYLFTTDKKRQEEVINEISFGGGCINDTIVHLANGSLPFGGVGESGMGAYHGSSSFETFTHKKSILKKSNAMDIPLRYPPFKNNLKLVKKVMG